MALPLRSWAGPAAALLLATTLGSRAAAAAEDGPPGAEAGTFAGEVAVTVVNLDVMVRDRDGRPVEGLTAADFRVLQDGVEMPITNFAAFSAPPQAPLAGSVTTTDGDAAPSPPERPPISMVLYVDSANLHPLQRNRVLDRVRTFVRDRLSPPLAMMVVATRPHLEVLQPFTDDPEAVIAALDGVSRESGGRFLRDAERQRILQWLAEVGSDRRASLIEFTELPDVRVTKTQLQGRIASWVQQERFAVGDALVQLEEALTLLAGLEGRRSLLHISSGLSLTPGVGLLHEFAAVFRDSTIFTRVPQASLADRFRELAVAANRAGVSLYAIDATGLAPPEGFAAADRFAPGDAMASAADLDDLQGSLRYLAETTGGLAVVDSNDPTAGLERLAEDLGSWYSIGYGVAAAGRSDVAHRVEVELPAHPAATVRCRQWFVETSPETRLVDRVLGQLARAAEDNPLGLRMVVGDPAPDGDRRLVLPVRLSVPLRSLPLTEQDGALVGRVEVCVAVRDARGRRSEPTLRTVEVRVPAAAFDPGRDPRYAIELRLAVRDREHTVAAGILDRASGLISSTRAHTSPR